MRQLKYQTFILFQRASSQCNSSRTDPYNLLFLYTCGIGKKKKTHPQPTKKTNTEDMNFRYIFCCWSVLSGMTEKYFLKPHCCIKTVLWDSHLQGALSISRPFVASVDISVFFLPQTPRLPAPEHTSTESRDMKPLRLALKYSYPLLLKLCLLAGCQ